MDKLNMNNKGIPPLAGISSYEGALVKGYTVDENVNILKRYNYVKKMLNQLSAAHLAKTPEWEVKCALGYHLWLDAEHSSLLRTRVSEMREPPLHMDKIPDLKLKAVLDEVIHAETTLELIVGVYGVVRPELLRSMKKHLALSSPIADQPTCRALKIMIMEEEEILQWGTEAIHSIRSNIESKEMVEKWSNHVSAYLQAAGGILGDLNESGITLPKSRSNGTVYIMDATPQRDERFKDHYNRSALIDEYYRDASIPMEERAYALLYKRLREMDVPEWMAPIIYKTKGKPWSYYVDMSRQLWDEVRHAMLGEIGLYQGGVPFYKYPVDLKSSMSLNTQYEPIQAHLILWAIEQSLMPKNSGKQWEWEIANQSDNKFAALVQDYDWADEVLHAQIGRKWIVPEFDGLEKAKAEGEVLLKEWSETAGKYSNLSEQKEWWTDFMNEIKAHQVHTNS